MPIVVLALIVFVLGSSMSIAQDPLPPRKGTSAARRASDLNAFGLALHRAVREESRSAFFSPWSVAEAFLFVRGCTTGEVRREVDAAFRFQQDGDADDRAAVALRNAVTPSGGPLRAGNRLWLHSNVPAHYYRAETIERLTSLHGSGLQQIDFDAAALARTTINAWIAERTEKRIPELVPDGVIDAATRMVITNAVFFKDAWVKAFDAALTKDLPFHVSAKESVPTPLLDGKVACRYATGGDGSFLELPFAQGSMAFFAALPPEGTSLSVFEDGLDAAKFAAWRAGMKDEKEFRVRLPKMKCSTDYRLDQRGLPELGLNHAFELSTDWSPLVGDKDRLRISYVGHQATFELDENGAEAAAATVVVVTRTGSPRQPRAFIADRPFLFAILHRTTGAMLFLGRYVRPPS